MQVHQRGFPRLAPLFTLLFSAVIVAGCSTEGWQSASRQPAGIAPNPATTSEAVVQIYAADAWGWRGWFAVHTWIAVKPQNAPNYTVYEVVGFRVKRGLPALTISEQVHPDRYWYGAKPELIYNQQGKKASELIPKIEDAVNRYPWKNNYRVFPGPNSNTFPAWVIKEVDGLNASLPLKAIGSGYAE